MERALEDPERELEDPERALEDPERALEDAGEDDSGCGEGRKLWWRRRGVGGAVGGSDKGARGTLPEACEERERLDAIEIEYRLRGVPTPKKTKTYNFFHLVRQEFLHLVGQGQGEPPRRKSFWLGFKEETDVSTEKFIQKH